MDGTIDALLSKFLQKPCHLVELSKQHPREISDPAAQGVVSFADGFPYLLIGSASLDGLNKKLKQPLTMQNFRPNIVVKTSDAHEEDRWLEIQIGDIKFRNVKPCIRCVLTTINPATAVKSTDMEPLTTLMTYRKNHQGKVHFGCNLIPLNEGTIKQGDKLEVLSYQAIEK